MVTYLSLCKNGTRPKRWPRLIEVIPAHLVHAMIGLGENMCEPDTGKFSITEPLAIAMGAQMVVDELGKAQMLHLMQQERDVIHPLGGKGRDLVHHTLRLPQSDSRFKCRKPLKK